MATTPPALSLETPAAPLDSCAAGPHPAALAAGQLSHGLHWCVTHDRWRDLDKLQLNSDGDFVCIPKHACHTTAEEQLPSPPADLSDEATTATTCVAPQDVPTDLSPPIQYHDAIDDGEDSFMGEDELRCWSCARPGHFARQCCPSPPLNHLACYECGGADHMQRACPLLRIEPDSWLMCDLHERPRGCRNLYWCDFLGIWRCKPDQQCPGRTPGPFRVI